MNLQTRLLLHTIPLIVLPILLFGVFSYRSLQKGFEEQVQLEGEQLCQIAASRIEQRLDECFADILLLQSEATREWELSSSFQMNTASTQTGKLAQRFVIRHSPVVTIRIVAADGQELLVIRALHPESKTGSALNDPMFLPAVAMSFETRIPIQFPAREVDGKFLTTFSAPVFGTAGPAALRGFVFLDLDVDFAEKIMDEMNIVQPGLYVIFDGAGQLVAGDPMALEMVPEMLQAMAGVKGLEIARPADRSASTHTVRQIKEYIAFREPILEERWFVAVVPLDSPLESAFRGTRGMFFVVLTGALALGIAGTVIISRRITRPIATLVQGAQRVARGELESQIPVDSKDEIGMLTREFNKMAGDLKGLLREKQTNEALLAVGRLSSSLVHDLRNPIEGLKLLSSELCGRLEGGNTAYEVADAIHQSVGRLSSFLHNSLDFARLTHPVFTDADIVAIADEAANDVRSGAIVINTRYEGGIRRVEIDTVQIKRVLVNILQNAVEACRGNSTDEPGIVELMIRGDDDSLIIEISDNGPGIAPDLREKIFEPFFSTKAEGHGLGLSFARQIIKNHGGTLTAESEPGERTRFIIVLSFVRAGRKQPP